MIKADDVIIREASQRDLELLRAYHTSRSLYHFALPCSFYHAARPSHVFVHCMRADTRTKRSRKTTEEQPKTARSTGSQKRMSCKIKLCSSAILLSQIEETSAGDQKTITWERILRRSRSQWCVILLDLWAMAANSTSAKRVRRESRVDLLLKIIYVFAHN